MELVIGMGLGCLLAFAHWWVQGSYQLRWTDFERVDALPRDLLKTKAVAHDRAKAIRRQASAPLMVGGVIIFMAGIFIYWQLWTGASSFTPGLRAGVAGLYLLSSYAFCTGARYLYWTLGDEPLNVFAVHLGYLPGMNQHPPPQP